MNVHLHTLHLLFQCVSHQPWVNHCIGVDWLKFSQLNSIEEAETGHDACHLLKLGNRSQCLSALEGFTLNIWGFAL
jgi:hypothetical protein